MPKEKKEKKEKKLKKNSDHSSTKEVKTALKLDGKWKQGTVSRFTRMEGSHGRKAWRIFGYCVHSYSHGHEFDAMVISDDLGTVITVVGPRCSHLAGSWLLIEKVKINKENFEDVPHPHFDAAGAVVCIPQYRSPPPPLADPRVSLWVTTAVTPNRRRLEVTIENSLLGSFALTVEADHHDYCRLLAAISDHGDTEAAPVFVTYHWSGSCILQQSASMWLLH